MFLRVLYDRKGAKASLMARRETGTQNTLHKKREVVLAKPHKHRHRGLSGPQVHYCQVSKTGGECDFWWGQKKSRWGMEASKRPSPQGGKRCRVGIWGFEV